MARVGRCAAAKGEAFTAGAGGWQALQANLDELTLDARVSARLRWDKSLEGAQIQVAVTDGAVDLKGTVRDEDQRRRAVGLAESTVGVGKVNDLLVISEP
jgi:osmotically-inducible protein OsmY